MTLQRGAFIQLTIAPEPPEERFITVGGLQTTSLAIRHSPVDSSHLAGGMWRMLTSSLGQMQAVISATGLYTDSEAEQLLRMITFLGEIRTFEVKFENKERLSGPFLVTEYRRSGEQIGAETYSITLESAGEMTFGL